ncbi:DNA cytosine methyltransferase [Candidatus Pacearchaeota archaeon]|nr:DNA cytosine methyltransferase [Candidatus Pacearchaeota archaeon]
MKLLDLFCGAGGAAMGYHLAGFEVIGVDIKPQPRYPFEFHQADALTYPLKGFDVIHASPPCQAYSKTNAKYRHRHPDLIKSVRKRIEGYNYVIENVPDARKLLKNPLMLCGGMFGLPIHRHRYFEISPFVFTLLPQCNVPTETVYITGTPRPKDGSPRRDPPAHVKRAAMGTPWMTIKNMDEAIPPAYTEYIGKQLMRIINR